MLNFCSQDALVSMLESLRSCMTQQVEALTEVFQRTHQTAVNLEMASLSLAAVPVAVSDVSTHYL